MKTERPIPSEGDWFKRSNKGTMASARYAERPTDLIQIGKVDQERQEFEALRVDGFTANGEIVIGRRTKISFATWADEGGRRYEPTEPPVSPAAEEPAPESGVTSATPMTFDGLVAEMRTMHQKIDELLALAKANGAGPLFSRAAR